MVKILEFAQDPKKELSYNLVDDTCVFMRNDPMFYRKEFFPAFAKIADAKRSGKKIDARECLMPMVEKGINGYCDKFKVAKHPDSMYKQEDREAILQKLFSEEMKNIEKGDYA